MSSIINLAMAPFLQTQPYFNMNSSGMTTNDFISQNSTSPGNASIWLPGTYIVQVFDVSAQNLVGEKKFVKQ